MNFPSIIHSTRLIFSSRASVTDIMDMTQLPLVLGIAMFLLAIALIPWVVKRRRARAVSVKARLITASVALAVMIAGFLVLRLT